MNKLIWGFVTGAAIGAVLGVLFAPDKGEETRRRISEKGGDVADSLKDKFGEFVDGVKDKFSNVKGEAEDVAEKGYSAFNRVKSEAKTF